MKPALVVQLARFGDVVQTKRLVAGLAQEGREVHLLVDASLAALARMVYPGCAVHALHAHTAPDQGAVLRAAERTLAEIAGVGFGRVFTLNHSGLSLAVSALFDPAIVHGYSLDKGQPLRPTWAAMAFRWTRRRRLAGINLADFWAGFHDVLAPAPGVNPDAAPRGGGLGVVLAGRDPRRSLPPQVLAGAVQAALVHTDKPLIHLLGTASERQSAKELSARLPARLQPGVRDLTGRTDWAGLAETVAGLDMVLTPDTGVMHLAAHLGVPVTALFLSSAWCHETGPYGEGHTVWQAVTDCAPCLESAPCPHGVACLEPFGSREFLRALGGAAGGEPPAGLAGYRTGFDALGVVCRAFAQPPGAETGDEPRRRLRALAVRYLATRSLGVSGAEEADPDWADLLVEDPDFLLHNPQASFEVL